MCIRDSLKADAWATDSYEIRGLCRLDAVAMDKAAAFKDVYKRQHP